MSDEHLCKIMKSDSSTNEESPDSSHVGEPMEIDDVNNPIEVLYLSSADFNKNCVIDFTNGSIGKLQKETSVFAKVLKFPSNSDWDEVLVTLSKLKSADFPNLYIFIIDAEKCEFVGQKIQENNKNIKLVEKYLLNFSKSRPMLLQITSKNGNVTKIFYKDENSEEFNAIDHQVEGDTSSHQNLSSFLKIFMNSKNENFDAEMIDKMLAAKNSSLILRLFRTLELSEEFWEDVALKCAENGTKDQLLAALDVPFDVKGQMPSLKAQRLLTSTFIFGDDSDSDSESDQETSEQPNNSSDEKKSGSVTKSILSVAVENSNKKVVEFLAENFSHLIQELRRDHQIDISTNAFNSEQFNVLCDLIQYADFPFPRDFNSEVITHERLQQIVTEREIFHTAIAKNDFDAVKKFIEDNSNLKLVYDVKNETALSKALSSKSFNNFLHLKSFGFEGVNFGDYRENLSEDEKKIVDKLIQDQVQENVNSSLQNEAASAVILANRSRIHNIKKYDKETQLKQRSQIHKWFNDINKTVSGKDMIDVAAQCDHLKIVFDFECDKVINLELESAQSLGITLPEKRWIFIGAKMSNEKREQEIKGVLAHEMSHYTMRMVFENNDFPYHKNNVTARESFENVESEINVWTYNDSEGNKIVRDEIIDDECDGIISTVFTLYDKEDHHPELIVRVQHILAQYDNDPEKVEYLMTKFKPLFDFNEIFVMPELRKFNSKKRKFNKLFGFLPQIEDFQLEFANPKDLSPLNNTEVVIAVSNVPQLLFHDIYNQACAHQDQKPFIDDKIVFIKSKKFNNPAIANEYMNIQTENKDMRIYVDCSKEFGTGLGELFVNQSQKIIFVVQSKIQCGSLSKGLDQSGRSTQRAEINYEFKDLTLESRKKFLPFFVTFQNYRKSLFRLILSKVHDGNLKDQQETRVADDLIDIVDGQMMSLLMEKSQISINSKYFEELSNDMNFILLLHPRKFIKIFADKSIKEVVEVSEEQLVAGTRNQKYVIISDIAGTGKSWAMKSIAKFLQENFGTCWVTCVDLKQFINAFDALKDKPDFPTFMVGHVLKDHQKFEAKFFTKLYEKGKTFVLFDGFDEISPKYYETVVGIIKSFESNGGNQMWIATRDHFEIDLQERLKVNVAYKLDEFTKENGIDLIAAIWTLTEEESTTSSETYKSVGDIKKSEKFNSHQRIARKLVDKISRLKLSSIGFPQFYKMIAEVFKDNRTVKSDLNNFKIYNEFVEIQLKRWSHEKGDLRVQKSTESQRTILSFTEVHQFLAMKSFFPDEDEFCGLELDDGDWSDEEIVGCGLVTKSGENFLFSHETFREFFAADFILSNLKNGGSPKLMEFFIEFLKVQKYEVIRMFINDGLENQAVMRKIESKMTKLAGNFQKNICGNESICASFIESYLSLTNLIINLLKIFEYAKVKNILHRNIADILANPTNSEIILKFQEFFIEFLEVDDLKEFILGQDILNKYIKVMKDLNIINDFIERIDQKNGRDFVREVLILRDSNGKNIFLQLCAKIDFDESFFEDLFDDICPKYFTQKELLDLLNQCDHDERNILHICAVTLQGNGKNLELVWKKVENFFAHQNSSQDFKQLLKQNCQPDGWNVLHCVAKAVQLEFHKIFWELLLETFENREELVDVILKKDRLHYNFIHALVKFSTADIIEFTFEIIRKNFSDAQFQEILMSKGFNERNLLQAALSDFRDINIHKTLWTAIKKSSKSNENIVKMIKHANQYKWNIFHYATAFSTNQVLLNLFDEAEKLISSEEIRKMLSVVLLNRNILYIAAEFNKSMEIHQSLWKILNKYFQPFELLTFVKLRTVYARNVLEISIDRNTLEIVEVTWSKVRELFDNFDLIKSGLKNEISQCDLIIENVRKSGEFEENFKEKFNEIVELLNENFKVEISQKSEPQNIEDVRPESIKRLAYHKDIHVCEAAWENWLQAYKNQEELKKLIVEEKFMHELVSFGEPPVIKFTLKLLKEVFNDGQLQDILECRGYNQSYLPRMKQANKFSQNLLFTAINFSLPEILKLIWSEIEQAVTADEMTKLVMQRDEMSGNILHSSGASMNVETFEFVWEKVKNLLKSQNLPQKFKELLKQKCLPNGNIVLQLSATCKNLKFHETFWKLLLGTVDDVQELTELILQSDDHSHNYVHSILMHSTADIIEFTFKILKENFSDDQFQEFLNSKGYQESNLLQYAVVNSKDIKVHTNLWNIFHNSCNSNGKFMEVIQHVDEGKRNVFHLAAVYSTSEIFEFMIEETEKIATREDIRKLLSVLNHHDGNLLHSATSTKSSELHESLWKILQKYFDRQEILDFINHSAKQEETPFMTAAKLSTKEIMELTWTKIQSYLDENEQVEYLKKKDKNGRGLMELCIEYNQHREVQKWIEKILKLE